VKKYKFMKKFKKNIMIVLGGTSRERQVSLSSGKACLKAIKRLGFNVKTFDPQKKNFEQINKKKIDIIFNSLHGKDGEDGIAQSYFEYLKIPYTHSGVISSMKAMDKEISKKLFIKKKILTPNYFVLSKLINIKKNLIKLIKKNKINFPIVIKPINEGSSIGVRICKNLDMLIKNTNYLFKNYETLIFEQYIQGQEVQAAVLNNKGIGAIELKPKRIFYDYKAKYSKSANTSHIMPAAIPKKKYIEVLKIAEKVHKVLKCRGVTRSDFKFYKNKFYLLEINTQPGMTDLSLVPEIAKFKGISFNKLIERIILDASINK
jgi:D-alanine-D-alanine ligase